MILVCGEALFDVFVTRDDAGRRVEIEAPGGSPFNVAIGLARLGREAAFFGGVSRDRFGDRLVAILAREGVDVSHAPRRDAPTTLAYVELQPDRSARYDFRGAGAADRAITSADLPALAAGVRALTFGSYSTVVRPVGEALLAFARREAGRRVIVYDPNIRPTVEPAMAIWRDRCDAFAATAGVVKMSADDLAHLSPGEPPERVAARFLAAGAALVAITRDADGISAFGGFGRINRPTAATAVVDTVGAGDSVTAAIIAWLDEQDRLSRAAIAALSREDAGAMLDFAMRAAAVACARRGADLPRRGEVA